jgi:uncharacterized oxidoreductase
MGLDSHGIMRVSEYVVWALSGQIKPGALTQVVHETATTALVDCGFNFGQVSATRLVAIAAAKASTAGTACVVSRNCNHVGRLGAWPQKLAEQGLFALAFANSTRQGHWVVPWGGREGRLATNPLAYAVPTGGQPIVMDMSTAAIAEGKIRVLLHQGISLPAGTVIDSAGRPTTDPAEFYGPPHGWILPFGSDAGYKGFGLSLLVEILGGVLAGYASSDNNAHMNGMCLLAIDPDKFCGRRRFQELMDDLSAYMTSATPRDEQSEVVMPGALDFRSRERRLATGIPVPDETWRKIAAVAERLNVDVAPYAG